MNYNIVIDSCFWIALLDPRDNRENSYKAKMISSDIENEALIIPFPTLYEFVNSRLSRRDARFQFETLLSKPNIIRISDIEYKDQALDNFFTSNRNQYSDISLVDEVIKLILDDRSLKLDFIVTFDKSLLNYAIARGIRGI
jgi:predicted nucleic acid-binding protein